MRPGDDADAPVAEDWEGAEGDGVPGASLQEVQLRVPVGAASRDWADDDGTGAGPDRAMAHFREHWVNTTPVVDGKPAITFEAYLRDAGIIGGMRIRRMRTWEISVSEMDEPLEVWDCD
jgi:hypothetical protein